MDEQDQLNTFILAKQRMIESILAMVVVTLDEPIKTAIRASSEAHAESREGQSLFSTASDEEREISKLGCADTLLAVFGEAPPG